MRKTTFIYELIDPRNDLPFYIGKADNLALRLEGHLRDINCKDIEPVNINKVNVIESILKDDLMPEINALDEVSNTEWQFWEKHYISLYKSFGFNLTNATEGGEGGDTFTNDPNKELRRKRTSEFHSNRKQSKEQISKRVAKLRKLKRSVEQRKTQSISALNRQKIQCKYCKKSYDISQVDRWHNENCKENPNRTQESIDKRNKFALNTSKNLIGKKQTLKKLNVCIYCGFESRPSLISRHHNDNCRFKDMTFEMIDISNTITK